MHRAEPTAPEGTGRAMPAPGAIEVVDVDLGATASNDATGRGYAAAVRATG